MANESGSEVTQKAAGWKPKIEENEKDEKNEKLKKLQVKGVQFSNTEIEKLVIITSCKSRQYRTHGVFQNINRIAFTTLFWIVKLFYFNFDSV